VDFITLYSAKTALPTGRLVGWSGIGPSKFHDWKQRYGKVNEHNRLVPRDHWLLEEEKEAIVAY